LSPFPKPKLFDGPFLTLLRQRAGMSLDDLATKTGTAKSHLWDIEHGKTDPTFSLVHRLGEALGVQMNLFAIPERPKRRSRSPDQRLVK
jgi:transcriptional regulator with XRE-family HTH domain